jgi:hypothetical protein
LFLPEPMSTPTPGPLTRSAAKGEMLFHGPYWFMRSGVWRFRLHGEMVGEVRFGILERFGHIVAQFCLTQSEVEHVFVIPRDLLYFECAAFAESERAEINVRRLEFMREG